MLTAQPVVAEIEALAENLRNLGLPVEVAEPGEGSRSIRATTSGIPFSAEPASNGPTTGTTAFR
jgi:hypothetical protein